MAADTSGVFQCFFNSKCDDVTDFEFSVDFDSFTVNEKLLMEPVMTGDVEYCQIQVEPTHNGELILGKSFVA